MRVFRRPTRARIWPAFLPVVLLLGGCVNGRAILLFEQPWMTSLRDDARLRVTLTADVALRGYFPRVEVLSPQERPLDRLLREAGTSRRGVVVVGPLLSYEWRSFVSRFPATRFVLIGDIGSDGLPPNATVLRFDRVPSFREAGRRAAGAAHAAGGGVGIIVSDASELSDAETSAFTQGATESGGAPVLRSLPGAPDKSAVQAAIEDLRAQGIVVFLVGLGSLDPWALEVLKTSGGKAVLSGWRASGALPDQVMASVEEDVPAGIGRALSAATRRQASAEGPVSILTASPTGPPEARAGK